MKKIDDLTVGDYIAFQFDYGSFGKEIVVDKITSIDKDQFLVHFLNGYKSESVYVDKDKVIAIGDHQSSGKIKGWSGTYNILLPDHELLNK